MLAESQASVSPNIPYRLVEYALAGLRSMVESEPLLYSRTRVQFPVPKLYVLQVGLEVKAERLPGKVQYDMRLSESYVSAEEKYGEGAPKPDLDATVHVYDFRMSLQEMLAYIEAGTLPERFGGYDNDMRDYALVANGITYMQRVGHIWRVLCEKGLIGGSLRRTAIERRPGNSILSIAFDGFSVDRAVEGGKSGLQRFGLAFGALMVHLSERV